MKFQDSAGFEFLAVSCSSSSLHNKNDVMMDSCMLQQHAHAPVKEIWLGSPDRFLMSGWGMGYTDYIIISQSVHSDTSQQMQSTTAVSICWTMRTRNCCWWELRQLSEGSGDISGLRGWKPSLAPNCLTKNLFGWGKKQLTSLWLDQQYVATGPSKGLRYMCVHYIDPVKNGLSNIWCSCPLKAERTSAFSIHYHHHLAILK